MLFEGIYAEYKNYKNLSMIYLDTTHSIYNLRYKRPTEIPVFFTMVLITGFEYLGENTEKYITFSKQITHKTNFIESVRLIAGFLSSLIGLRKIYTKVSAKTLSQALNTRKPMMVY